MKKKIQRKQKYNNKITIVDGIKFHSKREADRYCELKELKDLKEIIDFELQVPFKFACGARYVCDFKITWKDNNVTYEDVKGIKSSLYGLKKKLMKHEFGIEIHET